MTSPQKAPTMETITVTMQALRRETRLLVMEGSDERQRPIWGPATASHLGAAATLVEGLALWLKQPISVVLCVDDEASSAATRMFDALGFGVKSVHYEVEVAFRGPPRRGRRVYGGQFGELRQQCRQGVAS